MFSIFKGYLLGLLHDRPLLVFFTLFPTLLVFILGTLLGNLDAAERTVEPFELAYVIDSDDPVTIQTAEFIITQFDGVEQLVFTEYDGHASVDEGLTSGALGGAVVFTEPFAIEIHEGRDPIQNRATRTIFEGVARLHGATTVVIADALSMAEASAAAAQAAAQAGAEAEAATQAVGGTGTASSPADPALLPNMPSFDLAMLAEQELRVEEKTYGISRTMLDYYAITMIVMMFFMGSAMSGAAQFYEGRKNGTLRR
ncbi:MAG: hypothetical protein LBH56_05195, partial [Coriobacteriales bacterium]|nr:hypothetical protein [Coriobacteriales bacterium]